MEKIKIILADDHKIFLEGLVSLLSHENDFQIVGKANDGAQAYELTKKLKPDIVVLDVSMPKLNGIECAKNIKKDIPETKIILLTMHKNIMIFKTIKSDIISGVVLKDNTFDDLVYAIRSVYKGGKFIPPSLTELIIKGEEAPYTELTNREKEILRLVVEGLSAKEIAEKLYISPKTVETHKARIMKKFNVSKTSELIKKAIIFVHL